MIHVFNLVCTNIGFADTHLGCLGHCFSAFKVLRLKTLAAAAFFGYLFFAVDHIYGINMEQLQLA
jgi:hypothetical protein